MKVNSVCGEGEGGGKRRMCTYSVDHLSTLRHRFDQFCKSGNPFRIECRFPMILHTGFRKNTPYSHCHVSASAMLLLSILTLGIRNIPCPIPKSLNMWILHPSIWYIYNRQLGAHKGVSCQSDCSVSGPLSFVAMSVSPSQRRLQTHRTLQG